MKATEQESQEVDQQIKKNSSLAARKACCFLFISCQQRAVGVIRRSAADPGQDPVKRGRFLLPVKGGLQGKRQGCCGGIRPQAGSVKPRQPPVIHAQSLQPTTPPHRSHGPHFGGFWSFFEVDVRRDGRTKCATTFGVFIR